MVIAVLLLCTACRENRKGGEDAAADTGGETPTVASTGTGPGGDGAAGAGDSAGDGTSQEARESPRIQLDLQDRGDRDADNAPSPDTMTDPGAAQPGAPDAAADGNTDRGGDSAEPETVADREARRRISELGNPSPFVLPGGQIVRAMPQDMVIGPLQDRLPARPEERGVVTVAHRFLAALVDAGSGLDTALEDVVPERRDAVRDWLVFSLDRYPAPQAARLGEVEWDGTDQAWFPFVFRRGTATAAGEIHLASTSGDGEPLWQVTDVLVQFGDLTDEDREEVERFEPTEYPATRLGP